MILFSYLLGSIPFGLLLMKYGKGIDVRSIGSGNIGATNVLRTGKKGIAAATLFLDAAKGLIPVLLAFYLKAGALPYLCGAAAVLGHIFPIWLKFKGGKGVATALGVVLGLSPLVFLGVALSWLVTAKIWHISSVSALVAFALSPLYAWILEKDAKPLLTSFCIGILILLLWTHRNNIQRLIRGQE